MGGGGPRSVEYAVGGRPTGAGRFICPAPSVAVLAFALGATGGGLRTASVDPAPRAGGWGISRGG